VLKVGDRLPDLTFETTDGRTLSSADLLGKNLIVYFFPKAFTPGCTKESARFRDAYPDIQGLGAEVIGVSVDDHKTQCDFMGSLRVTFPMVGDKGKKISKAFGVLWPIIGLTRRITFVFDKTGVLRGVFSHEFQILKHLDESLQLLKQLNA
jgi:peroxiredoxin